MLVKACPASRFQSIHVGAAAAYVPLSFDPKDACQFDWRPEMAIIDESTTTTLNGAHAIVAGYWTCPE
ncbi:hypothetical protein AB0T83_12625 [Fluviibacterium sp. DFM31]|uniref:Uncharacterized protein n=2 Tax=Meridianimarinicoccus marinus TaxID=3231483 RepID=A0ABV3L9A1_9RHOB